MWLVKRAVHHDGHVHDDLLDNVLCRVIDRVDNVHRLDVLGRVVVSDIIDVHRLSLAAAACER